MYTNPITVLQGHGDAFAYLTGSAKYSTIHGVVTFYKHNGSVVVRTELHGLQTGTSLCDSPIFAIHIHDGESCSGNENDPFAGAGTHFNPDNCPHPYHAGDLPPVFGVNGDAFSIFLTGRFDISEVLGKAVILHSLPDDFSTQPSGNSGEKIACGIIKPFE